MPWPLTAVRSRCCKWLPSNDWFHMPPGNKAIILGLIQLYVLLAAIQERALTALAQCLRIRDKLWGRGQSSTAVALPRWPWAPCNPALGCARQSHIAVRSKVKACRDAKDMAVRCFTKLSMLRLLLGLSAQAQQLVRDPTKLLQQSKKCF